jgi:hypothetical protein
VLITNAEGRIRSHPVNAYITVCNKGSCLQFHMSSPCALLFHGLAIFIKWDIILNKWFKHFTTLLLITRLKVRTFGSWLSNKKKCEIGFILHPTSLQIYRLRFVANNNKQNDKRHQNTERFHIERPEIEWDKLQKHIQKKKKKTM